MRIVKLFILTCITISVFSCSNGGPLTPVESLKTIREAANNNDYNAILKNLSSASHVKIAEFIEITGDLNKLQTGVLAAESGLSPQKLKNMKPADCVALYFATDVKQMNLRSIINEEIIAVDIDGSSAVVKTAGGYELDFVREGPYWKLDISRL